ncbi:sigma factor-like helix-turn-helix DNA-binding protein [Streptomyces sp. NPDC050508]|uniref:RNA polymerase sigma factor n=1 Tax=Streptomyces sp. NPDC050508 TaxID=3155405 RepID=UPI00341ACA24
MSDEAPRTKDEFSPFFRARFNPTVRRLMAREPRLAQVDAEVIVSIAFEETSRGWSKVRDPEAFLWDRVSLRLMDFWRKNMRRASEEYLCADTEKVVMQTAPKDGEPEHCIDVFRLQELIGELSPLDQRVIAMDYLGATCAEQAKALGMLEGTFRVCLHRAKQRLKKLVDGEAGVR